MTSSAAEIEVLRRELEEAHDTLRAIREGEVDAFVLQRSGAFRVATLAAADTPYRVLVESMRDGAVTISGDGTILYSNRPFAEHVAATPEEIIGRPIAMWLEFAGDIEPFLLGALHGEASCEGILQKPGAPTPVLVNCCALPREDAAPVFCLLLTDVSERRVNERLRTEQAMLARQRAELDGICSHLPFAVVLAELPDAFSYVNPAAERLLDRHDELRRQASNAAARILAEGGTTHEESVLPSANGGESVFRLYATSLDVFPAARQALIVLEDITAERQALKTRDRQEQLREAFVGILGHDLRAPLSAIMSSAELLGLDPTPEHATEVAQVIQRASARMRRLINDMLDLTLSRIGGGIPITVGPTDLEELVGSVVEELRDAGDCRCEMSTNGDPAGEWDADRLRQVLTNLVANALQHGRADSPVRIHIDGSESQTVCISITNEGSDIPAELLPVLFDPFQRGERAKRGSDRGVGLGLYIAERLVTAHGGRIGVCSANSETTFTVELPRRAGEGTSA